MRSQLQNSTTIHVQLVVNGREDYITSHRNSGTTMADVILQKSFRNDPLDPKRENQNFSVELS